MVVLGGDEPEVNTPTELMVLNGILTAFGGVSIKPDSTSDTRRVGQSFSENNSNNQTTPREGEKNRKRRRTIGTTTTGYPTNRIGEQGCPMWPFKQG
jgi:hypothetical protein